MTEFYVKNANGGMQLLSDVLPDISGELKLLEQMQTLSG